MIILEFYIFNCMKIFIANLPHKMDETELKTMLTQFGQVASVKLVTDKETGKRKGFGFVEMPVYDQGKNFTGGTSRCRRRKKNKLRRGGILSGRAGNIVVAANRR
jgi:hypothetical protein